MTLSLQEKKRIVRDSSRAFGPMELAGDILRRSQPDLVVNRKEFRKAESITLIREKRDSRSQNICFASRPFVLCGLPVRRLPKGQLLYERRNGRFTLQVTGHPEFGVPFGQDRIVPIFLATMAVRQQSPVLRFKSAAQMLETFGMQKGGKEYRRLIAAFERIFGATISFGTHEERPAARLISKGRFNFLRQAKLWYSRDIETAAIGEDFENEIVLSDEFYSEINAHRIPTDLEAVKHLIDSPAVLDLFNVAQLPVVHGKGRRTHSTVRSKRLNRSNRFGRVCATQEVSGAVGTMAGLNSANLARMPGAHRFGWKRTGD